MKRKHFLLAACMLVCGALCLSSCGDDDGKGSTSNPVESVVMDLKSLIRPFFFALSEARSKSLSKLTMRL